MEAKDLVLKGNTLEVKLTVPVPSNNTHLTTILSPEYMISGCAVLQLKVTTGRVVHSGNYWMKNLVFIRFVKCCPDDHLTYTINLTSSILQLTNKCFTSDDGTWHLLNENKNQQQYIIDVAIQLDIVPSVSFFSSLHEDIELTDFELRGTDGSVRFHKAVLAASSPVLNTMLRGAWRETTEGHIEVPGTSKMTLQHLKNYMYLNTLPDDDLRQLLTLSAYYMMPELEQRCAHRLVNTLTDENASDLLDFAVSNKVNRLVLAILACVQNRAVDVIEMRGHFLRGQRAIDSADKMMNHNNGQVGDQDG